MWFHGQRKKPAADEPANSRDSAPSNISEEIVIVVQAHSIMDSVLVHPAAVRCGLRKLRSVRPRTQLRCEQVSYLTQRRKSKHEHIHHQRRNRNLIQGLGIGTTRRLQPWLAAKRRCLGKPADLSAKKSIRVEFFIQPLIIYIKR